MPKILGMGASLPSTRVRNDDLAGKLETDAARIGEESGVDVRYYAVAGQGPSDFAREASVTALEEGGIGPEGVDFIIFATMTPDVTFPGSGCYLQDKLGCGTVGALDLRAQCCGFLAALDVAEQFLRAGGCERILIGAADVHSSGLDFSPRGASVTPLFGDGGAAVLVGAQGEGLLGTVLHTDPTDFERFWCEFPSSRRRPTRFLPADLDTGKQFPRIDAGKVKDDGRKQIRSAVEEVLDGAGVARGDVSRFFLHHVYPDVAARVAEDLGVADRANVDGRDGGHIASASLPIALCRARERGEVVPGDLVCLATAGSGANWGASLIRL